MRLLFIDPQSYNNLAQYDYNLLKNIDCDIVYCCSSLYDAPVIDHVEHKKIFDYSNKKQSWAKALSYIASMLRLIPIVIKHKPDIIHIQWWRLWLIDYLMLSFYKHFCKKVVFTAHNVVPHNSGDSMKSRCIKYYKKVDSVIVHTEATKQELIEDFGIAGSKISVIRHGLLKESVNEDVTNRTVHELTGQYDLKEKLVFSALGIQSEYKGTLLIKTLLQKNMLPADAFIFIVGKGDIIKAEDFNGRDNICVIDQFVSKEFFHAVMRVTDVLLLPYQRISQSGVLLTAISNNIPYLATNVGGLTEPLSIADIGWQIENGDETMFFEKIKELVNDVKATKAKRNNADNWRKVQEHYQWESIGRNTQQLYEQII